MFSCIQRCFFALTCAPTLCCFIGRQCDYEVTLRYPALYAWITAACALFAILAGYAERNSKQEHVMKAQYVMPVASMLYAIMMLYLASWEKVILPVFICPVCAAWLFHLNGQGKRIRSVFKAISILVSPVFVILVLMLVLLSDFGKTTVVQQIDSPEERYRILLVDVDQGALGGSTDVFIEHKRDVLDFGFFALRKKN